MTASLTPLLLTKNETGFIYKNKDHTHANAHCLHQLVEFRC